MKPQGSFRLFRSGLIGSVVLGLAVGGHLAGGGQLPAPAILAALCAVTMVPVAALTRFKLSFPVLAAVIGAGQLWLHTALEALSAGVPTAAGPALGSGHAGHIAAASPDHHALVLAAGPVQGAAPGALMFTAHALATLATALLLARGERALGVLAGWLAPLLHSPEPVLILPARGADQCVASVVLPTVQQAIRLPAWRGPPAHAAVV